RSPRGRARSSATSSASACSACPRGNVGRMQCPACGQDNPGHAKFCLECGQRLPAPCAACGHPLVTGGKFCVECGAPAPPAPAPTVTATPSATAGPPPAAAPHPVGPDAYTPRHLAEKI